MSFMSFIHLLFCCVVWIISFVVIPTLSQSMHKKQAYWHCSFLLPQEEQLGVGAPISGKEVEVEVEEVEQ